MEHVAVFGIGSTNFRYATARPDGTLLTDVAVEPTRPHELPEQLIDAVDELERTAGRPLDGVAVSAAGLVDAESGMIRQFDTPAGETVDRIELGRCLEAEHGLPLALENDCNAAALAEWYFGGDHEHDTVGHVTMGTGIGGGIVDRGRLVRGNGGQAGEIGLLPIARDTGLESCGVIGAWEAVCSGRGIPQYVRQRLPELEARARLDDVADLTAKDVFRVAEDGAVAECLDEVVRYNAAGIGAVCNAFNPGLVTLGGSVALNHEEWLLDGIEESLAEFCFVDRPEVRTTDLGDDIGLYGALATYRNRRASGETVPERQRVEDAAD